MHFDVLELDKVAIVLWIASAYSIYVILHLLIFVIQERKSGFCKWAKRSCDLLAILTIAIVAAMYVVEYQRLANEKGEAYAQEVFYEAIEKETKNKVP